MQRSPGGRVLQSERVGNLALVPRQRARLFGQSEGPPELEGLAGGSIHRQREVPFVNVPRKGFPVRIQREFDLGPGRQRYDLGRLGRIQNHRTIPHAEI